MDPRKQHAIVAIASFWTLIVTVVSCLMMAGVPWFRAGFYYGDNAFINGKTTLSVADLRVIDSAVATSVAKCVGAMIILVITYHVAQMVLTRYRPSGPVIDRGMARFDRMTSFMPLVANVIVFGITRIFVSHDPNYDSWWLWLQGVYFLIIIAASTQDVWLTIKYWRANRAHM